MTPHWNSLGEAALMVGRSMRCGGVMWGLSLSYPFCSFFSGALIMS